MRRITGQLTSDLKDKYNNDDIRRAEACHVDSFAELMKYIAQLSYLNKDYLLFFRGQSSDYKNKAEASTFYPSIYRGERLSKQELEIRFELLKSASSRLVEAFIKNNINGVNDVKKRQYIQWSILQHYEVCQTPLLDFTQSARVACSFASLDNDKSEVYFFVFGLPYVTNRISINSEHDLINIRLLSICPPDALRPYCQEGYLVGTDGSITDFSSKDDFDFNARLIAKFKFTNDTSFWRNGFDFIPKEALYPENDRIEKLCKEIAADIGMSISPSNIGMLLQSWVSLEGYLINIARDYSNKVYSVGEAIRILYDKKIFTVDIIERLDRVRKIRNDAVHSPLKVNARILIDARTEIDELSEIIKHSIDNNFQITAF